MGFPLCYPEELFIPNLLLHALSLLGLIRKLICSLLQAMGLGDIIDSDSVTLDAHYSYSMPDFRSVSGLSAARIRDALPIVAFDDLRCGADAPENCVVCLYDFEGSDEIRRLKNCRHIFHRRCLDRWMAHDQKTCPLCRTPLVHEEIPEGFKERVLGDDGLGFGEFYGEYSYFLQ